MCLFSIGFLFVGLAGVEVLIFLVSFFRFFGCSFVFICVELIIVTIMFSSFSFRKVLFGNWRDKERN